MAEIGKDIDKAKALLEAGELVAIPTETVYGLAGNALDVKAVSKIFSTKNRPSFDPLIVHIPNIESVEKYARHFSFQARRLAEQFWPGPLTLLLPRHQNIPDLVTSGLDTVGVRCPDQPLTLQLLQQLSFPLAAPSANPFGYISPTRPEHVEEQLGDQIAYILDGGICEVGIESTIVGFENDTPVVYRTGGLSLEKIQHLVGKLEVNTYSSSNPKAPGQLQSHYAPRKKMILGNMANLLQQYPAHTSGLLTFRDDFNSPFQQILSPSGDLDEAAQRLFTALRLLDKMPVDIILAERVPAIGLGVAINDRLQRASTPVVANDTPDVC
jgi:L-threonylcarbamoyladenylate synthase